MSKDKVAWIMLIAILGLALFLLLDIVGIVEFFWH
jgi:hypothetical protein